MLKGAVKMDPEKSAMHQPVMEVPENQVQPGQVSYQQPVYQQNPQSYQQPVPQFTQQPAPQSYQQPAPQSYQQQSVPQFNPPPQYGYAPQQEPKKDITKPFSTGRWFGTLLVMCIPVVNIIMLFVWAFGSRTNISKRNFFRAELLMLLIVIVLFVVSFIVFGSVIFNYISDTINSVNFGG